MSTTLDEENLSDESYVTVILRLVIDRREALIRGEVVDTDGQSQGWFTGWQGLIRAVRDYLISRIVV